MAKCRMCEITKIANNFAESRRDIWKKGHVQSTVLMQLHFYICNKGDFIL